MSAQGISTYEESPYEIFAMDIANKDRLRELNGMDRFSRAILRTLANTGFAWRESVKPTAIDRVDRIEFAAEELFTGAVDFVGSAIQTARESVSVRRNVDGLRSAIDEVDLSSTGSVTSGQLHGFVVREVYGTPINDAANGRNTQ